MLSARSLFWQIHDDDESFRLFCSIAVRGEEQGGWENGRIAQLVGDPVLVAKIVRHGADEDKHGRIFRALLRKRGLAPVAVPDAVNYTVLLERAGIGLAHDRLRRQEPLSQRDLVVYLAHSRVTEQRAAEQMRLLRRVFGGHPQVGRAVRMICADEDNHLAYCHEELLRLAAGGHREQIRAVLRQCARAEIRTYRDVSLAVTARMGRILHWSRPTRAVLALGIHGLYAAERLGGWRRMTTLKPPATPNPLGTPALTDPEIEN